MDLKKLANLLPEDLGDRPNRFTLYMGKALREAREAAGLSQEDLAHLMQRRQASLSDMENGKIEFNASDLWLAAAYLKKPLSYFYPPYARENIRPEEMGPLEHELLMHFIQIQAEDLKKLAIQGVKAFAKYDPMDLYIELKPFMDERIEQEKMLREHLEKRRKKKR